MKRKKKMAAFSLLPKEGHVGLGLPITGKKEIEPCNREQIQVKSGILY
jgi:hypothetical protein